jgi:predicted SAM-dependent methyltransferase
MPFSSRFKHYIPAPLKQWLRRIQTNIKHAKQLRINTMEGVRNINIGSSTDRRPGFLNIDIDASAKPDIVRDIEKGLPFDDNSVNEIYCSHTLEHIHDLLFVLREFYRVLKPGARLTIVVPLMDASDMTHVRFFNKDTFRTVIEHQYWEMPYYFVGKYKELSRSFRNLSTCEEMTIVLEALK